MKNRLIVIRDKCISCGACVPASEGRCDFKNSKVWCEDGIFEDNNEVIEVCPVDALIIGDEEEFLVEKKKMENEDD
jgi:Fe-S-cluster-containing hydrogenase component 2